MKTITAVFIAMLFIVSAFAQDKPQTCVILKRSSAADHAITGIEFYYVEGHYPNGYKFRTNLRGRHARKLEQLGGKMVILESKYTAEELQQARKSCEAP